MTASLARLADIAYRRRKRPSLATERRRPARRTRLSPGGKIGATSLELIKQPWDIPKQTGKDLIAVANKSSGNGLEVKLGGGPIQDAEGGTRPQGVGFLGAAIVLLIAFGSIVAVGLPLAVALFGLGISSGLIGILAAIVDVPDWATAISSLMLIGVGIDDAMLGPFFVGLSYMHGVALAASISVFTVMLGAITLLPALLSFAGHQVNSLRIPVLGRRRTPNTASDSPALRWSASCPGR